MNRKIMFPPESVESIETIEDILTMTVAEKRELLRWWKDKKARESKPSHGGKRQPNGKFESA